MQSELAKQTKCRIVVNRNTCSNNSLSFPSFCKDPAFSQLFPSLISVGTFGLVIIDKKVPATQLRLLRKNFLLELLTAFGIFILWWYAC